MLIQNLVLVTENFIFLTRKKPRFVTNCTADDVGGVHSIDPFSQYIIITKSYKDYRVIKNQGF